MNLYKTPSFSCQREQPAPPLVGSSIRLWRLMVAASTALSLTTLLSACGVENSSAASNPPPTSVDVNIVQTQTVTDWDNFTGHFEAVESVQLRPRVSGYIDDVLFDEGSDVTQGQVLFVIDQRPYTLQLQRAKADMDRASAELVLAKGEMQRAEKLLAVRAVSQEEFDQKASRQNQLIAEHQAARAVYEEAQLNMEYTKVVAPVAGRVSRAAVTRGNYVTAGETILTSVVSLDPIYVEFSSDEERYSDFRQLINDGVLPAPDSGETPVFVGLANDDNFPYTGQLKFIDNAINPTTGTIAIRALLSNPDRRFTPGMLARARLQGSAQYQAAVVDDTAISTLQGRRYVYVVDDKGIVQHQPVTIGDKVDGQRVILSGLRGGEKVIVSGLQRVRPGATVDAKVIDATSANKVAQH